MVCFDSAASMPKGNKLSKARLVMVAKEEARGLKRSLHLQVNRLFLN
jgi:hypothetical protein